MHDTLRARVRQSAGRHKHATAGSLDSQSVKRSAITGCHGFDSGKKIDGRKRHILVDTLGLLIAVVVTTDAQLAAAIKHLPITLAATRPIDEAISSAGGVRLEALDAHLMSTALPGLFVAGEMLDWEAPTGGYLLSACLASGRVAGLGAERFLGH